MATFYMMWGLPASGKSYFANKLLCDVVSSDAIRRELYGSEEDQSHNHEVFNEVYRRVKKNLVMQRDVVLDATNLSKKRRVSFLKELPQDVKKVIIVMATELDLIYKQNSQRGRVVPEAVIKRMIRTMSLPSVDEGWDCIRIIPHPDNKKSYYDYLSECFDFDQDNPHHSLSLDKHMLAAANYVLGNKDKYNLNDEDALKVWLAAQLHDIGKPLCKTYELWSGKKDNHAHYYNHAEVGAYLFSCSLAQIEEKYRDNYAPIFLLIKLHMLAFDKKEKCNDFILENYGERFLRMYECLHDADLAAH